MAAVATSYAHPAPAPTNYPHTASRARGYRICDTCGSVEQPGLQKFRMCGGCMITQYCSPECQKRHWPSHKAICQHTSSIIRGQSHSPTTSKRNPSPLADANENLAKNLRKFCSAHQTLLGWAGFQALQLKKIPANVRQSALLVELGYNGEGADSARRFSISSTHIVPRTYITSRDPLVAEDIQRREDRCRRAGGIGTLIVLIQCGELSQVMPVECDPPQKISWDVRDDWEKILGAYVDAGRTDFMPISTTSKGVYYG